jgi:hypothetical protein
MIQHTQLPTFRGRTIGITVLTALQLLVGVVHVFFGFWLLTASISLVPFSSMESSTIYSVYIVAFGFAATSLAFGIWFQRRWGSFGTVVFSLFVVVADLLAVLGLPSVPGIPKFAAGTEILYSLIITGYLLKTNIGTNSGRSVFQLGWQSA